MFNMCALQLSFFLMLKLLYPVGRFILVLVSFGLVPSSLYSRFILYIFCPRLGVIDFPRNLGS